MPESFFNNIAGLGPATLLKKEALEQVFSGELCEISKNTFFYRTRPVKSVLKTFKSFSLLSLEVGFKSNRSRYLFI